MGAWELEGAIDGTHTSSDFVLKNDQNNKYDFHFGKRQFEISFNGCKHHRNRKCVPFIEISNQNV